jgi:hypothetical protein
MALFEFLNTIIGKLKKGSPLDSKELLLIKDSIEKGYVNGAIFAKAIINAYTSMAPHKKQEGKQAYGKLQAITTVAINRKLKGEEPFTDNERKELVNIFDNLGLDGKKVALSYISNFNVVFGMTLNEGLDRIKEQEIEPLTPQITKKEQKEVKKQEEFEKL